MNIREQLLLTAIFVSCMAQGFASDAVDTSDRPILPTIPTSSSDARDYQIGSGVAAASVPLADAPDYQQISDIIIRINLAQKKLGGERYGEIRKRYFSRTKKTDVVLKILKNMECCCYKHNVKEVIERIIRDMPSLVDRQTMIQTIKYFDNTLQLSAKRRKTLGPQTREAAFETPTTQSIFDGTTPTVQTLADVLAEQQTGRDFGFAPDQSVLTLSAAPITAITVESASPPSHQRRLHWPALLD